ncbi:16S rRNA m(7)G-527 methyltransferase [Branchiibius hedensis]|uniref:Ribosomal RNA small subunit methyltransferase G n=1 Tax=Branchiibius hedensis TaxID=672460 RepID=A0A2Y8ZWX7_9MICO|nr:16S rRNA (guanine(527)-N(7))-methyltransferase RsmG [Branchiibius hedensis]PWJ26987.1 16S rRNA m(7)G-527 methyltransferase [Branchiibius hedensis]SSA35798.1 16S rRNA m(7)G-527 methyltransferase [Branchiibius hedensis]
MVNDEPAEVPEAPEAARSYLGEQFELMSQYVGHLATSAISHGLIGPRERDTLWTRHVLNCAVLGELIEPGESVIDVGSGAGLPGLVLGISRPDLDVTLVEPLLRRSTWLSTVVADLGLTNVTVRRDRAEAVHDLQAQVVTSRAVARLDRLTGWCAPLVAAHGRVIAIKGATAYEEVAETRDSLTALGVVDTRITQCGVAVVDPPTTAVELVFGDEATIATAAKRGSGRKKQRSKNRRRQA